MIQLRERRLFPKFTVLCGLIVLILVLAAGVYAAPANYIAIDINPSIEMEINQFEKIVNVNAVNSDAEKLLNNLDLKGMKIETAVNQIINCAVESGYLAKDKDNVILVTGADTNKSGYLVGQVESAISDLLQEKRLNFNVEIQEIEINKGILQEAHNSGISAGKFSVIQKILAGDASVTIEDLASVSIEYLFAYAKEHNISEEELIDEYEDVWDDALEAAEEALEAAEDSDDADDEEEAAGDADETEEDGEAPDAEQEDTEVENEDDTSDDEEDLD